MPNPEGTILTLSPLYSSGTFGPSLTTVNTITTILINASADALASFVMSRYSERGYETSAVQRIMTTERFVKILRMEEVRRGGKTAARTCGIVSPTRK